MKAKKFQKVLITLDYDPSAQKVAETGFAFAKNMDAQVILLHVIADPEYYVSAENVIVMGFSGFNEPYSKPIKGVKDILESSHQFLEKTKKHLGDETIQVLVKEGDFAETILKTAKEVHANVIVMGSHGKKWLEKILMGSVTEKVLRHTRIPLFIIPTQK